MSTRRISLAIAANSCIRQPPRRRLCYHGASARPGWTTSRPRPLQILHQQLERIPDVAERRTQAASRQGIRNQDKAIQARRRCRSPSSPSASTDLTEHFKTAQEGQSFAARPAEDGEPAPPAPRLCQAQGRGALSEDHRAFGNSPLARHACVRLREQAATLPRKIVRAMWAGFPRTEAGGARRSCA